MSIRVMLADDHALLREALSLLLQMQPDIEVVSEVADGHGVLREFEQSRADVVCMDIGMAGLDGIETTRQLLALHPAAKVIGVSAQQDLACIATMFDAGALGYVVKGSASAGLLQAIRRVSQNQTYLDPVLGIGDPASLAPYSTRGAT